MKLDYYVFEPATLTEGFYNSLCKVMAEGERAYEADDAEHAARLYVARSKDRINWTGVVAVWDGKALHTYNLEAKTVTTVTLIKE